MVIIIEKIVGFFFFFFFKPLKVSGPMLQQRLLVFFERPIQRESAVFRLFSIDYWVGFLSFSWQTQYSAYYALLKEKSIGPVTFTFNLLGLGRWAS